MKKSDHFGADVDPFCHMGGPAGSLVASERPQDSTIWLVETRYFSLVEQYYSRRGHIDILELS